MPVDIDEFREAPDEALAYGEGTQPRAVLRYLARNADSAFSQSELAEATGIDAGSVGAVLSRLEDRGLVRHRGRYWAIGADDRLAVIGAQETASSASVSEDFYE